MRDALAVKSLVYSRETRLERPVPQLPEVPASQHDTLESWMKPARRAGPGAQQHEKRNRVQ